MKRDFFGEVNCTVCALVPKNVSSEHGTSITCIWEVADRAAHPN